MTIDVTPIFENTTMQAYYNSENVLRGYDIRPCEGYVLHSKKRDYPEVDEETMMETGRIKKGYTDGLISVGFNYDFEVNPDEIYAELKADVISEDEKEVI